MEQSFGAASSSGLLDDSGAIAPTSSSSSAAAGGSPKQRRDAGMSKLHTEPNADEEVTTIKVACRLRPLTAREMAISATPRYQHKLPNVLRVQDSMIVLLDPEAGNASYATVDRHRRERMYNFDNAFPESATNEQVYDVTTRPLVDSVMQGYNSTSFCYGMTGAGKTYSMIGEVMEDGNLNPNVKGIYTLAMDHIFSHVERDADAMFVVRVSFLEIYNEKIKDLLVTGREAAEQSRYMEQVQQGERPKSSSSKHFLELHEDPVRGMIVQNLTEYEVESVGQVQEIIMYGNSRRTLAPTGSNSVSSRSHAIFQVSVEKRPRTRNIVEQMKVGKLSLIDLAGSERAAASDNRGMRMVEGANINRSLLALGNCINILSDKNKRGSFVPYRDSKLTRLLKDSLGGNTKTVMIANVSPSVVCYEETLNTLKYASRAKSIQKKVHRNTFTVESHISQYKQIIESLRSEISELKLRLSEKSRTLPDVGDTSFQHHTRTSSQTSSVSLSVPSTSGLGISGSSASSEEDMNPIVEQIRRTEEQKNHVRQILQRHQASLARIPDKNVEEDEEFEDFSRKLLSNFQKKIDLSHDLMEIDEQNAQNHAVIERVTAEVDQLQEQMEQSDSEEECHSLQMKLKLSLQEISTIERNTQQNELIKQRLLKSLEENDHEKLELQQALLQLKAGSQRSILELQVSVHQLKLEKLEMQHKYLELKRDALLKERERQAKEHQLQQMKEEVEQLRAELEVKRRLVKGNGSEGQAQAVVEAPSSSNFTAPSRLRDRQAIGPDRGTQRVLCGEGSSEDGLAASSGRSARSGGGGPDRRVPSSAGGGGGSGASMIPVVSAELLSTHFGVGISAGDQQSSASLSGNISSSSSSRGASRGSSVTRRRPIPQPMGAPAPEDSSGNSQAGAGDRGEASRQASSSSSRTDGAISAIRRQIEERQRHIGQMRSQFDEWQHGEKSTIRESDTATLARSAPRRQAPTEPPPAEEEEGKVERGLEKVGQEPRLERQQFVESVDGGVEEDSTPLPEAPPCPLPHSALVSESSQSRRLAIRRLERVRSGNSSFTLNNSFSSVGSGQNGSFSNNSNSLVASGPSLTLKEGGAGGVSFDPRATEEGRDTATAGPRTAGVDRSPPVPVVVPRLDLTSTSLHGGALVASNSSSSRTNPLVGGSPMLRTSPRDGRVRSAPVSGRMPVPVPGPSLPGGSPGGGISPRIGDPSGRSAFSPVSSPSAPNSHRFVEHSVGGGNGGSLLPRAPHSAREPTRVPVSLRKGEAPPPLQDSFFSLSTHKISEPMGNVVRIRVDDSDNGGGGDGGAESQRRRNRGQRGDPQGQTTNGGHPRRRRPAAVAESAGSSSRQQGEQQQQSGAPSQSQHSSSRRRVPPPESAEEKLDVRTRLARALATQGTTSGGTASTVASEGSTATSSNSGAFNKHKYVPRVEIPSLASLVEGVTSGQHSQSSSGGSRVRSRDSQYATASIGSSRSGMEGTDPVSREPLSFRSHRSPPSSTEYSVAEQIQRIEVAPRRREATHSTHSSSSRPVDTDTQQKLSATLEQLGLHRSEINSRHQHSDPFSTPPAANVRAPHSSRSSASGMLNSEPSRRAEQVAAQVLEASSVQHSSARESGARRLPGRKDTSNTSYSSLGQLQSLNGVESGDGGRRGSRAAAPTSSENYSLEYSTRQQQHHKSSSSAAPVAPPPPLQSTPSAASLSSLFRDRRPLHQTRESALLAATDSSPTTSSGGGVALRPTEELSAYERQQKHSRQMSGIQVPVGAFSAGGSVTRPGAAAAAAAAAAAGGAGGGGGGSGGYVAHLRGTTSVAGRQAEAYFSPRGVSLYESERNHDSDPSSKPAYAHLSLDTHQKSYRSRGPPAAAKPTTLSGSKSSLSGGR